MILLPHRCLGNLEHVTTVETLLILFFFSSRRRHTRFDCDWSSDVCSSDLTRMDIPFLLGSMLTGNRDKARLYGFIFHLFNGWFFSFIYMAAFLFSGLFHW